MSMNRIFNNGSQYQNNKDLNIASADLIYFELLSLPPVQVEHDDQYMFSRTMVFNSSYERYREDLDAELFDYDQINNSYLWASTTNDYKSDLQNQYLQTPILGSFQLSNNLGDNYSVSENSAVSFDELFDENSPSTPIFAENYTYGNYPTETVNSSNLSCPSLPFDSWVSLLRKTDTNISYPLAQNMERNIDWVPLSQGNSVPQFDFSRECGPQREFSMDPYPLRNMDTRTHTVASTLTMPVTLDILMQDRHLGMDSPIAAPVEVAHIKTSPTPPPIPQTKNKTVYRDSRISRKINTRNVEHIQSSHRKRKGNEVAEAPGFKASCIMINMRKRRAWKRNTKSTSNKKGRMIKTEKK